MSYLVLIAVIVGVVFYFKNANETKEDDELPPPGKERLYYRLRTSWKDDGVLVLTIARQLQMDYWKPNAEEKQALLQEGIAELGWKKLLRLSHLLCSEMLASDEGKALLESESIGQSDYPDGENKALLTDVLSRLLSEESPYSPRSARILRGQYTEQEAQLMGLLKNMSMTHMGAIEVIYANDDGVPTHVDFLPLQDIFAMELFSQGSRFAYAKVSFDDGREDETMLVPSFYGYSWQSPLEHDQDGLMSRFICSLQVDGHFCSIGLGKQDMSVTSEGMNLVPLGAMDEIETSLNINDPDFAEISRIRGMPEEVIQQLLSSRA